MSNKFNAALLASTAFVVALAAGGPAHADPLADLQKQLASLQKEINALKDAQAQTAKTVETKADASALKSITPAASGVKVTLGGFMAADFLYRDKNQVADAGSNWNAGIPFANSRNAYQGEFRGSARATRMSLLIQGSPDKNTALAGYVEGDFSNAGSGSNSGQTNSYVPRLRHAYGTYDMNDSGWHFLAGQAFSLLTPHSSGMMARKETLPMTVDSGLLPGAFYSRVPQVRVVKDFDKTAWVGLSLESPETTFANTATAYGSGADYTEAGYMNTGTTTKYSTTLAPDVTIKAAYDTSFGHFEAFGLGRFYHARNEFPTSNYSNKDYFSMAGGASAFVPVIEKKLEVVAAFMGGRGVGRYDTVQLPDVMIRANGKMHLNEAITGYFGIIGHPDPTLDVYAYAGGSQINRADDNNATTTSGYGNKGALTSGCYTEGSAAANCAVSTRRVWQVTGGAWKKFYDGEFGNMRVGLQQSFTRRDAFSGANGKTPHGTENITMVGFRFSPKF